MTNGADPAKVVGLGYKDRTATAWYQLDYCLQLLPVAVEGKDSPEFDFQDV